jgi:transcriptional regulator with XRE-family HTH domain
MKLTNKEVGRRFNGEKLRELRLEKKWSQQTVEFKTNFEIHRSTISAYEINRSVPSAARLEILAEAFGVKPEVFLLEDGVERKTTRKTKKPPEYRYLAVAAFEVFKYLSKKSDYYRKVITLNFKPDTEEKIGLTENYLLKHFRLENDYNVKSFVLIGLIELGIEG